MRSGTFSPILPLTSIRFFLAIQVVLLHSVFWMHRAHASTWLGRFSMTGYTAVGFFFVLSGYILSYVYLDSGRPFNRRAFWTSRFARAYPLLLLALLLDAPNYFLRKISLIGVNAAFVKTIGVFLSECALMQFMGHRFRNIALPSWSLSSEAFFYLMFPFVASRIWGKKGINALGLFSVFWGCSLLAPLVVVASDPTELVTPGLTEVGSILGVIPIFRIFEFLAGICLYSLQKTLVERLTPVQLNRLAFIFLVAACALYGASVDFATHIPYVVMNNGLLLPVWGLLLLGLTNVHGWLAELLSHRHLVLLGESSYSIYLLHWPLWSYFSRLRVIDTWPVWCIYLGVLVVVSMVSFFCFERPFRRKILAVASVPSQVAVKQ